MPIERQTKEKMIICAKEDKSHTFKYKRIAQI